MSETGHSMVSPKGSWLIPLKDSHHYIEPDLNLLYLPLWTVPLRNPSIKKKKILTVYLEDKKFRM